MKKAVLPLISLCALVAFAQILVNSAVRPELFEGAPELQQLMPYVTVAPPGVARDSHSGEALNANDPCGRNREMRRFDFWVGEWEVHNAKGQLAGTSSVQLILDGCVIFENWTGASGMNGKSFNYYDATAGQWRQDWVDNRGSSLHFTGEYRDGAMRMTGQSVGSDGTTMIQKMTFTPLPGERVRQLWEQSKDRGKTWTVAFDGLYTRRK